MPPYSVQSEPEPASALESLAYFGSAGATGAANRGPGPQEPSVKAARMPPTKHQPAIQRQTAPPPGPGRPPGPDPPGPGRRPDPDRPHRMHRLTQTPQTTQSDRLIYSPIFDSDVSWVTSTRRSVAVEDVRTSHKHVPRKPPIPLAPRRTRGERAENERKPSRERTEIERRSSAEPAGRRPRPKTNHLLTARSEGAGGRHNWRWKGYELGRTETSDSWSSRNDSSRNDSWSSRNDSSRNDSHRNDSWSSPNRDNSDEDEDEDAEQDDLHVFRARTNGGSRPGERRRIAVRWCAGHRARCRA